MVVLEAAGLVVLVVLPKSVLVLVPSVLDESAGLVVEENKDDDDAVPALPPKRGLEAVESEGLEAVALFPPKPPKLNAGLASVFWSVFVPNENAEFV